MIAVFRLPSAGAATNFSPFIGTSNDIFGPPVSAAPNCWSERDVLIDTMTVHASVAPGVGRSHTQQVFVGAASTGGTCVVSGTNVSASAQVNALLSASATAGDANAHAVKSTPAGSPATAILNFTHWYEDQDDPTVCIFPFGNGSTNMGFSAGTPFIGFYGISFSATEGVRQTIMPASGTFFRIFFRYISAAGTTYTIDTRVNGSTIDTTTLPAATVGTFLSDDINVPVVAGDLVSFRINRTVGAGTTFIAYAQVYWRGA